MASGDTLLFLPDISGFTRFVESTEVGHSQHIIAELIELLIAEDRLGLVVAEVEGDAVFFHSTGAVPSLEQLVEQCRRMFLRFHEHLRQYATSRVCDCGACSTAERLTLKFVAHAGPVRLTTIHGRTKPFGVDVILAHRLLKNDLAKDEYVLLTDALPGALQFPADSGMRVLEGGHETYDNLPEIHFRAIDLAGLHRFVKAPIDPVSTLPVSPAPVRNESVIQAPPAAVYSTLIDLDKRAEWDAFATRIERPDAHLNRSGSQHVCVLPAGRLQLETVSGEQKDGGYTYVERALNVPFIPTAYTRFNILPRATGSLVRSETHLVPASLLGRIMLPFAKRRMGRWMKRSLEKLGTATVRTSEQTPTN